MNWTLAGICGRVAHALACNTFDRKHKKSKCPVEIVDFLSKNGWIFSSFCVCLPEGSKWLTTVNNPQVASLRLPPAQRTGIFDQRTTLLATGHCRYSATR